MAGPTAAADGAPAVNIKLTALLDQNEHECVTYLSS